MFKNILFSILICLPFLSNSQISFYGSIGANVSDISFENNEIALNTSASEGGFITVGMAAPISHNLYSLNELNASAYSTEVLSLNSLKAKYSQLNLRTGLGYQLGWLRIESGVQIGKSLRSNIEFVDAQSTNLSYTDVQEINLSAFFGLNISVTKNIAIFTRNYFGLTNFGEFKSFDAQGNASGNYRQKITNFEIGASVLLF